MPDARNFLPPVNITRSSCTVDTRSKDKQVSGQGSIRSSIAKVPEEGTVRIGITRTHTQYTRDISNVLKKADEALEDDEPTASDRNSENTGFERPNEKLSDLKDSQMNLEKMATHVAATLDYDEQKNLDERSSYGGNRPTSLKRIQERL